MSIEKKPKFLYGLQKTLQYISKEKISSAKRFEKELNQKFINLLDFPYQYRQSHYFDDDDGEVVVLRGAVCEESDFLENLFDEFLGCFSG